jgi:hypothetical protein
MQKRASVRYVGLTLTSKNKMAGHAHIPQLWVMGYHAMVAHTLPLVASNGSCKTEFANSPNSRIRWYVPSNSPILTNPPIPLRIRQFVMYKVEKHYATHFVNN